ASALVGRRRSTSAILPALRWALHWRTLCHSPGVRIPSGGECEAAGDPRYLSRADGAVWIPHGGPRARSSNNHWSVLWVRSRVPTLFQSRRETESPDSSSTLRLPCVRLGGGYRHSDSAGHNTIRWTGHGGHLSNSGYGRSFSIYRA